MTGTLDPRAEEIVQRLASYTEVSPNGTGLHIIVKGSLPEGPRKQGSIEMYDTGRYFTMAGHHVQGTPITMEGRNSELGALQREIFGKARTEEEPKQTYSGSANLSDQELIERANSARNGEKFTRLWQGDISGCSSPSDADLALCGLLAFWTNGDAGRIDHFFRLSGLFRQKWEERHYSDGRTYGQGTITKALENN